MEMPLPAPLPTLRATGSVPTGRIHKGMSTRQPAAGFPGRRLRPIASALLVSVLTCLLAGVHLFFYDRLIGLFLYRLAGGIHLLESGWTRYGGAPFAWTIPLQLPGTLL